MKLNLLSRIDELSSENIIRIVNKIFYNPFCVLRMQISNILAEWNSSKYFSIDIILIKSVQMVK